MIGYKVPYWCIRFKAGSQFLRRLSLVGFLKWEEKCEENWEEQISCELLNGFSLNLVFKVV